MPRIDLFTEIPVLPEKCFELSLSVDAHQVSMSGSGERVVGGVKSGVMRLGDTVTWRASHFGIPFTMTSLISAYDAPRRFVDEQTSGPFRHWWHEHRFEATPSGMLMTDVVEFESPVGPVGRLVNHLVLTRYMTQLLEKRNAWLVDALSCPGS
ncbi:SRPBCC family protein [Aeromicrobium sp. 50.2.37]|uniref:SRPBCC family protein n=1 Tax=Aeromicrobium sp. 50.2.37 TaxID=2969305 RepID=UPI0021502F1E|nr:SRPBCC family protein [Aeromicrobium sp. 50.2.37]MCR4512886.1 SRPBCC family protein [Aeromicrobium sp. 50.2.37]